MSQPKQIEDGDCRFYEFEDGHASAADGGGWVSALFVSLDAAKSWRDHFTEAEVEFLRINGGKRGHNLLPSRAENRNHEEQLK